MKLFNISVVSLAVAITSSIALGGTYNGGSGLEAADPYRISTVADWQELMNTPADWGSYFILTDDINFQHASLIPVGSNFQRFTGNFDGNAHVLRNWVINQPESDYIGLFGHVGFGGYIRRIGLEAFSITGKSYVGGLAGANGGMVSSSYSMGSVSGSWNYVGGLTGYNFGTVNSCYASGSVSGLFDVGGLAGANKAGTVSRCYAKGSVSGAVGVGGLAGSNGGTVSNSFWDTETSARTSSAGGWGLSSADMKESFFYSGNGWGGDDWTLDAGNDYPHLAWERVEGAPIADPVIGLSGLGTPEEPWIIESKDDLLLVFSGTFFWNKHYRLGAEVDLSGTVYARALMGYDKDNPFTGSFDGNGHIIQNLTIEGVACLGLFGYVGQNALITSTGLENASIAGTGNYVGGLVGYNDRGTVTACYTVGHFSGKGSVGGLVGGNYYGAMTTCYATGNVSGSSSVGGLVGSNYYGTMSSCYMTGSVSGSSSVGGLVGSNTYHVMNCYATSTVSGSSSVGGLVGSNNGTVSDCYATGSVVCSGDNAGGLAGSNHGAVSGCYATGHISGKQYVGGLAGANDNAVSNCYATGDVTGSSHTVGGLVGLNDDVVSNCHATGSVIGGSSVGGLTGFNGYYGSVISCYSLGNVSGSLYVGGLVGYNRRGTVTLCYATAEVGGESTVGGLVGYNDYRGTVSSCYATGNISGMSSVGGLVGDNGENSVVRSCYAAGSATASGFRVGGLVGRNGKNAIVSDSYAGGSVIGDYNVGGLVGSNGAGTVSSCYATGSVSGGSYVGGLVGSNHSGTVSSCYATGSVSGDSYVGGLVGTNPGTVSSSFWDTETSGVAVSAGGTGKATAEMMLWSTYNEAGWDFGHTWKIKGGRDYPRLAWEPFCSYSGGAGSESDPYRICAVPDWQEFMDTRVDWGKCFILMADLDFQGASLVPVGCDSHRFSGDFDGNGHILRNGCIDQPESDYVGLFGYVRSGGQIRHLGMESFSITGKTYVGGLVGWNYGTVVSCYVTGNVSGAYRVGGLIGYSFSGTVSSCYASCSVVGSGNYVGGLMGHNHGRVSSCHATGSVIGSGSVGGLVGANSDTVNGCYARGSVRGSGYSVGGLVGRNNGTVHGCHATGEVTGSDWSGGLAGGSHGGVVSSCYATGNVSGGFYVGGLLGCNAEAVARNCYATGTVVGSGDDVGGLVGRNWQNSTVIHCYATGVVSGTGAVGGLVGQLSQGSVSGSFWDTQTSGLDTGGGGEGKTTAQMQDINTYLDAGWDFATVWSICDGTNYPRLTWQIPPADWLCPDGVGMEDLAHLTARWLNDNCDAAEDCQGADLNMSGNVDMTDLAAFAQQWAEGL
ncbi:MAG: hypothetical protein IH624_00765 [Phycisphaerae bacterium]|nr:hypothetical protein [Phycisphaerae bacterium]